MEIKTISHLNSKLWYRLFKVVSISIVSLIVIFFLFIIYTTNQKVISIDNTKTTVDCHYPLEHKITASNGNLYFTVDDFPNGSYSNYSMNQSIQDACDVDNMNNDLSKLPPQQKLSIEQFANIIKTKYPEYEKIDNSILVSKVLEKYPVYKDRVDMTLTTSKIPTDLSDLPPPPKGQKGMTLEEVKYLIQKQKGGALFEVTPVFTQKGGWSVILFYSCLTLFLTVCLLEGLKRIFYYIIFGSFRPSK